MSRNTLRHLVRLGNLFAILAVLFALQRTPAHVSAMDSNMVNADLTSGLFPTVARLSDIPGADLHVYIDESQYVADDQAHLIFKRPTGERFTPYVYQDLGRACPRDRFEASKWLGGNPDNYEGVDTGFEVFWRHNGPTFLARVPFGVLEYYKGKVTAGSFVNVDKFTWRCQKPTSVNVITEQAPVPCFKFANVQTEAKEGGICYLPKQPNALTDKIPAGFTADFWDDTQTPGRLRQGVPAGESITANEVTFKPKR